MKLRAVEQLAEDQRDLLLDDARAVVLHADLEAVRAGRFDVDPDFGQDAGLFAGVERVVDGLLDGVSRALRGLSKPEQVAVLGEELADRNIALAGGHRLGRGPFPPPASGVFLRRRTVIVWLHFNNFLYRWRAIFGVAIFEHRIVRVLAPLTDRRGFGRPRFLRLRRESS